MRRKRAFTLPPWRTGWLLAGLAVAARLPLLDVPLNRDEGALGAVSLVLLDARLPYRDIVDIKPPLLYPAYLPFALACYGSAWTFRLPMLPVHVVATMACWGLAQAFLPSFGAAGAGALFAIAGADPSVGGHLVTPEFLILAPICLTVLLWWRAIASDSMLLAGGAGILLGTAILIKQQALPLLTLAMAGVPRVALVAAFLGGAGTMGLMAAAGLAAAGLLRDSMTQLSFGIHGVLGGTTWRAALPAYASLLMEVGRTQGIFWALGLLGFWRGPWRPGARRLAGWWLVGTLLGILMGRRAYPYYFEATIGVLAVTGGAGLEVLRKRTGRSWVVAARIAVAAGGLLACVYVRPLFTAPRPQQAVWLAPDNAFLQAEHVATRLAAVIPTNGRVFLAGSEWEIALLAGRRPEGRFPWVYYLVTTSPAMAPERDRWLRDLRSPDVTAAVFTDETRAWLDVYGSWPLYRSLRTAVLEELNGPRWRKDLVEPPLTLYVRRTR